MVRSHHLWYLLLLLLRDMAVRGFCDVGCASLGCKARVGVSLQLPYVGFRLIVCPSLMSIADER